MANQYHQSEKTTADELKEVPPHIKAIFGEPPLLNTENRNTYESLLLDIANQIRPQKALEWSWVKDLADLIWEIRRYRWQITLIL